MTITYRFTPAQAHEPLVLPLVRRLPSRTRFPQKLETVGDHLRQKRLELGLWQRQVAEQIGVDTGTLHNWEKNRCQPHLRHMPAIIRFLGYGLRAETDSWAHRLVQGRRILGLSQKQAARQMGVVQCTLARWERGERQPVGEYAARVERFLLSAETKKPAAAAAGRA